MMGGALKRNMRIDAICQRPDFLRIMNDAAMKRDDVVLHFLDWGHQKLSR